MSYFDGCKSASSVGDGCAARFMLALAFWVMAFAGAAGLFAAFG